jgi:cob(I)alamin adenosyltransferase
MNQSRIKKASCLIQTLGSVDTVISYIGLARADCEDADVDNELKGIQADLFNICAILAKTPSVNTVDIDKLDKLVTKYENQDYFKDFHIPGSGRTSAKFDVARAECRQAEINLWFAYGNHEFTEESVLIYMNRLSDLLWLLARKFGNLQDTLTEFKKQNENKGSI